MRHIQAAKNSRSLRLFGISFFLALSVGALFNLVLPRIGSTRRLPARIVVVSSSGQRIATLFEGLQPNPAYSLSRILAVNDQIRRCGSTNSRAEPGMLGRVFGGSVVYAQASCDPSDACLGNHWVDRSANCNTGGSCSGSYNTTWHDPYQNDGRGFYYTGANCESIPQCGCVSETCENGFGL